MPTIGTTVPADAVLAAERKEAQRMLAELAAVQDERRSRQRAIRAAARTMNRVS